MMHTFPLTSTTLLPVLLLLQAQPAVSELSPEHFDTAGVRMLPLTEELSYRALQSQGQKPDGDKDEETTPKQLAVYEFSTKQQSQELLVLVALYDTTNGLDWKHNNGWVSNGVIPCDFEGVLCNSMNYVTALEFPDNDLTGTLPASMLWDLQYLEMVDLSRNPDLVVDFSTQVSLSWDDTAVTTPMHGANSSLPGVILTNQTQVIVTRQDGSQPTSNPTPTTTTAPMNYLDVSNTGTYNLDGIERIADTLQIFDISHTQVNGDAMREIRRLSQLTTLNMNHVMLNASADGFFASRSGSNSGTFLATTSSLPVETMTNLQYWYASNSSLTGTIPSNLGWMRPLQVLDWSSNSFQGSLPTEMGNLLSLQELHLGQSSPDATEESLSGPLPNFATLPLLRRLDLSHHRLTGTIPENLLAGIDNKTLPLYVNLKDNDFVGFVPTGLTQFSALDLDVTDNYISSLDPQLCTSEQGDWMDGNVEEFGCNAILCPPGSYNEMGRQVSKWSRCEDCYSLGSAVFYGSTSCDLVVVAAQEAPPSQSDILEAFYNATGGPDWTNSDGWLDNNNECRWYGVECQGGRVRSITLPDNNLQGGTPTSFFQLTDLRRLVLTDNPDLEVDFTDMLPTDELEDLLVSNTATWSLTGISNATNLQDLEIIGTQISGLNLGELYSLTTLKTLNMGNNALNQGLPEAIGALSELVSLRAPNAALSGSLPSSLGALTDLVILDLAENSLAGPLADSLNQLSEVRILDLHGQKLPLGGPLPDLEGMGSLLQLDLSSNHITGPIPSSFLSGISDKLRSLRVILKDNLLTGTIPLELALFQEMHLDVTENRIESVPEVFCIKEDWMRGLVYDYGCDAILCPPGTFNDEGRVVDDERPCESCLNASLPYFGSIACPFEEGYEESVQTLAPSEAVILSEREVLELLFKSTGGPTSWLRTDNWLDESEDICDWFGVGCDEDDQVQSLVLSENGLTQSTPVELFQLSRLERLFMDNNPNLNVDLAGIGLSQARPRALKGQAKLLQASNLRSLVISNTATSSVAGISEANSLQVLDLNNTKITGDDFDELMIMESLESLNVGNTRINRAIADAVGNLVNLRELAAPNAGMTGTIPQILGRLSGLALLDLSSNKLIGTLPASLGELSDIRILDLHDQNLSSGGGIGGRILAFANVPSLAKIDLSENRLTGEIPLTFLSGVFDKSAALDVSLQRNSIRGGLPEGLSLFSQLNIDVTSNQITDLPESLCEQDMWMNGDTESFGCDGILCPPGSYNSNGRQISASEPCYSCPIDPMPFYGSTSCLDTPFAIDGDTMICPDGSVCYNHGVCLESAVDPGSFACDCTATSAYGIPFAGLSCEYKATDICHSSGFDETSNINSFCVNNGECKERVQPGNDHQGCACNGDLWEGDYCELSRRSDTPGEYPTKATVDIKQICPSGHVCENGSQCVESTQEGGFECDCTAVGEDQLPVAGDSCQHPATSLCSLSPPFTSFCVNGGACISLVQGGTEHTDCLCPQGFFGAHCETPAFVDTELPPSESVIPSSADEGMESWQMALVFVLPALFILMVFAMIIAAYSKARKKTLKYVDVDGIAESEYDKYAADDLEAPRKLALKGVEGSDSDNPPSIVDRALLSVPNEDPAVDTAFFSLDSDAKDLQGVERQAGVEESPAERAVRSRPPLEIQTGDSPTTSTSKSSDAEDSPSTTDAGHTIAQQQIAAQGATAALSEESDDQESDDEDSHELSTILEGTEASDMALHPKSPVRDNRQREQSINKELESQDDILRSLPSNESPDIGNSASVNSIVSDEFRDALAEKPRVAFARLPSSEDDDSNTNVTSSFIGDIEDLNDVNVGVAKGKSLFAGVQSEDSLSFLDHSIGMSEDSERSTSSLRQERRVMVSVEPGLAASMFGGKREASETSSGELSLNF